MMQVPLDFKQANLAINSTKKKSKMSVFRSEAVGSLSLVPTEYNHAVIHWSEVKFKTPIPSCRTQAAGFTIGRKIYIYGGIDVGGNEAAADEIWMIDPFVEQPEWNMQKVINSNLELPSGISRHTITFIENTTKSSMAIVIGGQRNFSYNERIHNIKEHNQASRLSNYQTKPFKSPGICFYLNFQDLKTIEGKELPITNSFEDDFKITDIDSHTSTYIKGMKQILIFGGYINQANLSDKLFSLDLSSSKMRLIPSKSKRPQPRCEHSCIYVEQEEKVFLFGGKTGHLGDRLNDLWVLNVQDFIWTELTPKHISLWPIPRSGHGMASDQSMRIYIFGGRGDDSVIQELNDLWAYNLSTKHFEMVHSSQGVSDHSTDFQSPSTAIRMTRVMKNMNKSEQMYDSPLNKLSKRFNSTISDEAIEKKKIKVKGSSSFNKHHQQQASASNTKKKVKGVLALGTQGNIEEEQLKITEHESQQTFNNMLIRLPIEQNIVKIRKVDLSWRLSKLSKDPNNLRESSIQYQKSPLEPGRSSSQFTMRYNTNFPRFILDKITGQYTTNAQKGEQTPPNRKPSVINPIKENKPQKAFNHHSVSLNQEPEGSTPLIPRINFFSQQTSFNPYVNQVTPSQNASTRASALKVEQAHKQKLQLLLSQSEVRTSSQFKIKPNTVNKVNVNQPNPDQSWDSRAAMSFRSREEMINNLQVHEKKLELLQISHKDKHKLKHQIQSNPHTYRPSSMYEADHDEDFTPISMNMKNTFIYSLKEHKKDRFSKHHKEHQMPVQKSENGILMGSRPCQRDGCVFLVAQDKQGHKYLVAFGGDRFKRAFNDFYYYKLNL